MSAAPQVPLTPAELSELRHDLRTPFNAIVGYTEMLLEVAEDEGLEALVEELERLCAEARDLLGVVNAALATGGEVRGEDLPRLGQKVSDLLGPLSERIAGLLGQARQGGLEAAVPDLERIRDAAGNLTNLVGERLLLDRCELPPGKAEPSARAGEGAAQSAAAGTVLVVDDNGMNRDLLCRRLEREGYRPVPCPGGAEALAALEGQPIDLVLLDVVMPGTDGYEVLRRIKASEKLRDLPVIMISALDELSSVVRCIEMGAEDYLPKPFDPVLLRARVGACLEKKRLRDKELEYLRGVKAVEEAASAVEAGTFAPASLEAVAGRGDELGRLARVFQHMAGEVRAREQRLRDEVQKLQIEIDHARKEREVEQILGSDFAQDLVSRAKKLRERLRKGG